MCVYPLQCGWSAAHLPERVPPPAQTTSSAIEAPSEARCAEPLCSLLARASPAATGPGTTASAETGH